ncbi:MAG: hypothetical protein IJT69_01410 [Clostridia bacterium]|nr:hypothetical protein [Clostridia bacterium]
MLYPQTILDVKMRGYYAAKKGDEIDVQYQRLLEINERNLLDKVVEDYRIVRALVELKLAVTRFLERGILEEDLGPLSEVIARSKADYCAAKRALFPEGGDYETPFEEVETSAKKLAAYVKEILRDFDALVEAGSYKGTVSDYFAVLEKYSAVTPEPLAAHFPESSLYAFSFLSVKGVIFDLIRQKMETVCTALFAGYSMEGDVFLNTVRDYSSLTTVPSRSFSQGMKESPVLFVCTPIREEFDILLNANLSNKTPVILQIDLSRLMRLTTVRNADEIARYMLFVLTERRPNYIAFYEIDKLSEAWRKDFYAALYTVMKYFPSEIRFVVWDETGDMQRLNEYNRLKKEVALLPADNFYLRLPTFQDVKETVFADAQRAETIRKTCVFMGYRGLNLLYARPDEIGLAMDSAKSVSDANTAACLRFLEALPDDSKLVPLDWGYSPDSEKVREQRNDEYNYDEIRDVSDARARAIISNMKLSIFDKCGEIVRYVLLADEDKSVWIGVLTREEREKRIAKAVRLVAYTMRLFYSAPLVTFVDTREGSWGGLCCGGGSEIKFKRECIEGNGGIEWTMDAILHELYHSLQHTLTDTDVDPTWHKKVFSIENERIATWYSNSCHYVDIDDDKVGYEVQAMETDARCFAGRCLGDQVYHRHTYERNRGTV